VRCPRCGTEITHPGPACPNCGLPFVAGPAAGEAFRPATGLAIAASALVGAVLAVVVGSAVVTTMLRSAYDDFAAGTVEIDDVISLEDTHNTLFWLRIVAFLAATAVVIVWCYRARTNVTAMGAQAKFARWWSIGAWLIPLVNLVMPALVVKDIAGNSAPRRKGLTVLTVGWWVGTLLAGFANRGLSIQLRAIEVDIERATTPARVIDLLDKYSTLLGGAMVADIVFIIAGILFILVLTGISRGQVDEYAQRTSGGAAAPGGFGGTGYHPGAPGAPFGQQPWPPTA
jgi:hypothetical protein